MIDFRYHLVSIVAVFLALAIGIVLGTTTLRGPVLKTADKVTKQLKSDNEGLRKELGQRQKQADGTDTFVTAVSPQLVASRLAGESVVIVALPGAEDSVRQKLVKVLERSGATVTGTLAVQQKYLSNDEQQVLSELTGQLKPKGLKLPRKGTYDRAAAELASAVVTSDPSSADGKDQSSDTILAGFKTAGYITTSGRPRTHATLAVVLGPPEPVRGQGASADDRALVGLARALDKTGRGAVLVGPPDLTQDGGLIRTLRADDRLASRVSTVDDVNTAAGRVVTVFVLHEETEGKTGQYGIGSGAQGYLPTPVPTPPTGQAAAQAGAHR
ncbi:MAG: copper transporter [Streptosporangiaceae bacterium]